MNLNNIEYIILDVDGVLLDWCQGFRKFHESIHDFTSECPDNWDLKSWVNHDDVYSLVKEFNKSPMFGKLNKINNVDLIHQNKYKIIALSSCVVPGHYEFQYKERVENLNTLFPNSIHDVVLLELNESKKDVISKYPIENTIFIDDGEKNIREISNLGYKSYLYKQSHNQHVTDLNMIEYIRLR